LDKLKAIAASEGPTPEQRQLLADIVAAITPLANRSEHPLSPDATLEWPCGLPPRVRLSLGADGAVDFRLAVTAAGAAYVMEREVTVADYAARSTAVPDRMAAAEALLKELGQRPRPAAASPAMIAVTYDEAAAFAASLGCSLPTVDDWRALRALAVDDAEAFDPGQVTEWCRAPDGTSASDHAEVVGKSWLQNDPDPDSFFGQRLAAEAGPQSQPKGRPDPTIGFRLAIPLNLPRNVLERLRDEG
jgi:hypothetical protein